MQKRIAVIGGGISGLVSANLLSQKYDVTLFEANNYIGGHTHTVDVNVNNTFYSIDTGFIVFNKKTYPNFCKLLDRLNIKIDESEMSFSFRSEAMGLEYNGHSLNSLFADRRNLIKPAFYRMLLDILRFNAQVKKYLQHSKGDTTIADFFKKNIYSPFFIHGYFLPMAAAIWSVKPSEIYATSAQFIFQFFENHGLLQVLNRPPWYVIAGGSRSYIDPLIKPFKHQIMLDTKVDSIRTDNGKVFFKANNNPQEFDAVVIATHSDQALQMLSAPSLLQQEILGAIPYQTNSVILHRDTSVLPKRLLAWASWNYVDLATENLGLTYYMNRLQNLNAPIDFCVSVNVDEHIQPDKIFKRFSYSHPSFTESAIKAQKRYHEINGNNNIYYCGAYWGYGFHEDGVKSGIKVGEALGVKW